VEIWTQIVIAPTSAPDVKTTVAVTWAEETRIELTPPHKIQQTRNKPDMWTRTFFHPVVAVK